MDEKTIRVIPFSGKHKDWHKWSVKFLAKARLKGFLQVLLGKVKPPKHDAVLDETKPAEKKQADALKANAIGFNELVLCMESEVCVNLVSSAVTTEQPSGDLATAWEKLKKKFEPKTNTAMTDLKKEFTDCKLELGEDPDDWITELETIAI